MIDDADADDLGSRIVCAFAVCLTMALTGCIARPTPENPARCTAGASGSHTHGRSDGWGNSEEWSQTVYVECGVP